MTPNSEMSSAPIRVNKLVKRIPHIPHKHASTINHARRETLTLAWSSINIQSPDTSPDSGVSKRAMQMGESEG